MAGYLEWLYQNTASGLQFHYCHRRSTHFSGETMELLGPASKIQDACINKKSNTGTKKSITLRYFRTSKKCELIYLTDTSQ